jgi:hypothetical protein
MIFDGEDWGDVTAEKREVEEAETANIAFAVTKMLTDSKKAAQGLRTGV